jgi:hypothetical protein
VITIENPVRIVLTFVCIGLAFIIASPGFGVGVVVGSLLWSVRVQ